MIPYLWCLTAYVFFKKILWNSSLLQLSIDFPSYCKSFSLNLQRHLSHRIFGRAWYFRPSSYASQQIRRTQSKPRKLVHWTLQDHLDAVQAHFRYLQSTLVLLIAQLLSQELLVVECKLILRQSCTWTKGILTTVRTDLKTGVVASIIPRVIHSSEDVWPISFFSFVSASLRTELPTKFVEYKHVHQ